MSHPGLRVDHFHHYEEVPEQLSRIEHALKQLERKMTALDDELAAIKASQDATLATVATIKTGVEALLAKLATVPTAGLTPQQQAVLDSIRDEAASIVQAASSVNTEANPAV